MLKYTHLKINHIVTKQAPILSHLFGAEFGLEILLELGKHSDSSSSQQNSQFHGQL